MSNRWLIWHPESCSLFEVFTAEEMESAIADGLSADVTGVERFETRFEKEKKMSELRPRDRWLLLWKETATMMVTDNYHTACDCIRRGWHDVTGDSAMELLWNEAHDYESGNVK